MRRMVFAVAVCMVVPFANALTQQSSNQQQGKAHDPEAVCPLHDAHSQMTERGEKGMGFSQLATTHHFLMKSDGGVIQVEVKDPADMTNRANIRMHLTHIAQAFANGDFDIPMFVHDSVPPGVPEMKRLREKIRYSFEEAPHGGRVVISSSDKESLAAIHKFLIFQIQEHKTGDPTELR
jgi:hypothetical protein